MTYPFYPGQTDYQTFAIPFASDAISSVLVSYKQSGRVVLEKETTGKEAIDSSSCRVSLSLTQAESLRFSDGEDILVQLNIIGGSGERLTSKPIILSCGEQYHRQII